MTEYNDEIRERKVTGNPISHSSTSSFVNQTLSRNASTEGIAEVLNEHEHSSSSDTTSNESNRSIHSNAQLSSIQPLLSSLDSDNYLASCITSSSSESRVPSSGSSLAQLAFQKFETYINETRADKIVPPLQEMICGYGVGLARLAQSTHSHIKSSNTQLEEQHPHPQQGRFLEPIALRRHIHSTPLLRRTPDSALLAINDEDECDVDSDEDYPPPAGLEILDFIRSRSTPLTTSENSAFGTILRTNSQRVDDGCSKSNKTHGTCGGSAFSLPPYAMKKAKSRSNERTSRPVIFNPIVHEDEILKTVDGDIPFGEMTSIEVTDVPLSTQEDETPLKRPEKKKSAASRTAKFLTDVRNLRMSSVNSSKRRGGRSSRKYRPRDGRENPARPASLSSDEQSRSSTIASAATTKTDELERAVTSQNRTENNFNETTAVNDRVRIQVNDLSGNNIDLGSRRSYTASSPEPCEILVQADHSFVKRQDSPDSTRFPPSISNSSGRGSQGTSTSSNGRSHGSHLSCISETDREVANVNLLQRDPRLQIVGEQIELSLSSDRSIRSGDLNGSISVATPDSSIRRDGASVRADRFFNYRKDSNKFRHLPPSIKRGGSAHSPTIGSSGASVNTSSSTGSDEPPKIVSYIDRKQISDLSALNYRKNPYGTSSPRAEYDQEVRDSSPSEQVQAEHSEIVFEGAHPAQTDFYKSPRPYSPGRNIPVAVFRKNRSLPPRSPFNNVLSSTTPPPRGGSPACNAISPPRQIVGHRLDPISTNLSKPSVMAPTSYRSQFLPHVNQIHHEAGRLSPNCDYYNLKPAARGLSPVYGQQVTRTYEESCIEILKSDSKDDITIPFVTPDKENP